MQLLKILLCQGLKVLEQGRAKDHGDREGAEGCVGHDAPTSSNLREPIWDSRQTQEFCLAQA